MGAGVGGGGRGFYYRAVLLVRNSAMKKIIASFLGGVGGVGGGGGTRGESYSLTQSALDILTSKSVSSY